jgi:hypothetical protein
MTSLGAPGMRVRTAHLWEDQMTRHALRILLGAACAVTVVSAGFAQQQNIRVRGTIERVDGSTFIVRAGEAGDMKMNLADKVGIFGVVKATLADIKPGAFIGVGATPQPDGSQRAIQVTIFADTQRGTGEGHRPWDRPNTTMTNATVETTVGAVDGQTLTVKYKMGERTGEQKIIVPPDATIRAYVVSDASELKPGANIAIMNATKKPDGTIEATRINVGRDGMAP